MDQSRLLVDLPSISDTIARYIILPRLVDDTLDATDTLTRSIDLARLISSLYNIR